MKRTLLGALIFALLAVLAMSAASKEKDEETLKSAASVMQAAISGNHIPADVLAKADCVLVLPNVKKVGFVVGGSGGRGAMSCRTGKDFSGKWSAPAMYSIGGASVGLQAGGSSTNFVLLVMDEKGVNAVLMDKTKLGTDASATAGPSSASSTSSNVGGSDIVTYSQAKGLFAGVSLDGATLHQDVDANKRLYGKSIGAKDIVTDSSVAPPEGAKDFVGLLESKIPTHK